jgi:subtilisin family serine protease
VTVSPADHSVSVGAQVQYSAVARDASGNTISGKTFTWGSSQTGVATISTTGQAAALAQGVSQISAATDGVSGETNLTVTAAVPTGASIQGTVTLSRSYLGPVRPGPALRSPAPQEWGRPQVPSKPMPESGIPRSMRSPRAFPAAARAGYVSGEWIVTYRPAGVGAPPAGSRSLASPGAAAAVGARIRGVIQPHLAAGVSLVGVSPVLLAARVNVANPAAEDSVVAAFRRDPAVQAVERNFIRQHFGIYQGSAGPARGSRPPVVRPNDPLYPAQAWHYEMLDLPRAWRTTTGSNTVLVAVVDDGIRFNHPGIFANLTNDGYDFVSNGVAIPLCGGGIVGSSGDGDWYDPDPTNPAHVHIDQQFQCISGVLASGNHGLHVAGTVGARGNDGVGVSGVAWTVRIRPVRVLGLAGGTDYDIAQGLLYAAGLPADNGFGGTVSAPSGARIINMSLGGPNPSAISQNAVIAATAAGSLIIAAAGNTPTSAPNYPAAYPEVLSVSALGPDFALASYSSFGTTIDVAAPGGDLQDGNSSFGIMSTAYNYVTNQPIDDNATWNGTSMASPHVAGAAALLLAANPGLTAAQLRARLENFAVDLGAAGKDPLYGFGLVSARNALTQSFAPPATVRVKLINSTTGALVATVAAQPNGSYLITDVPNGSYHVFAGEDEEGDALVGVNPRRWGAFGSSAIPSTVTVSGPGSQTVNFTIGFPIEVENNNTTQNADVLPIGGYLVGQLPDPFTDMDVTRIRIATAGTYTFETEGLFGSCAFALEEDTVIELLSSTGVQLALNDDIDTNAFRHCSRITINLSPGTYYLRTFAYTGQGAPGLPNRRYTVSARSGP